MDVWHQSSHFRDGLDQQVDALVRRKEAKKYHDLLAVDPQPIAELLVCDGRLELLEVHAVRQVVHALRFYAL